MVMGFSLALLALTLAIPRHFADLVADPIWLLAYLWSFGIICMIWFSHQRLFGHYFVPNRVTTSVNFILLATLVLMVYFVQVFVHLRAPFDRGEAILAYFGVQGIAFFAMGVLYLYGTGVQWGGLNLARRKEGLHYGVRFAVPGVFLLAATAYVFFVLGLHSESDFFYIVYFIAGGVLLTRITTFAIDRKLSQL
jgi:hypothetical protein